MTSKTLPYLTTLTPLRGIAALLVVVFHSNLMLMAFMPPGHTHFIENGWLWVDFFFILSGFIMSYVYGHKFQSGVAGPEYRRYLGARFARVYPLHLFTLVWAVICCTAIVRWASSLDPFFADMFNPRAAPASLLLIQAMHLYRAAPLNTPSWSLSTEWWVYMIFPLLVPFFSQLKMVGKLATAIVLVAFYIVLRYGLGPMAAPFPGHPTLNMVADFGIFRCLAGFLLGMLVFELYRTGWASTVLKHSWSFVVFFGGSLLAMHLGIMDIVVVAFFPFILLTAAYNQTTIKRLLDARMLQRLGDWSFSIYMVHVPLALIFIAYRVRQQPDRYADFMKVISAPRNYQEGAIICVILVSLTLCVAALTYRFLEVPARNYLNSQFETRRKRIAVEALEV